MPNQQHLPAEGFEELHRFSSYANWVIPGHVMLGRYPYVEPSRCRCFLMPTESSTFVSCLPAASSIPYSVLLHACLRNRCASADAGCVSPAGHMKRGKSSLQIS